MLDLLFLACLAGSSLGIGVRIVKRLTPSTEPTTDLIALALPVGLGVLSLAMFGLAECGLLTPGALTVLLLLGAIGGLGARRELVSAITAHTTAAQQPQSPRSYFDVACDLALAATLIGTLLTALAPVTDGDALCYHLQVPKLFLLHHSTIFDPDLHETIYPLVTEMLYAAALAFRGPVACRLVQWLLGVSFALSVIALARPILGARARWAGTIALLVPAISNGMGAPLNDVALAAFGNGALLGWMHWRDRPSHRAATLAGLLAGLAIGVKYPALVWVGILGVTAIGLEIRRWAGGRRRESQMTEDMSVGFRFSPFFQQLIAFTITALLIGGGSYLRAYLHTGNPVYPFFRHTFGGAGIDDVLDPIKRPMAVTPWNLVSALGPLTLQPNRFDNVSHQFGPAFLLFLPALLLMRPPRRVLGLVMLGWLFITVCLTQRQSMRFFLTAIGPLSIGVAWVAHSWREQRTIPARLLLGLMALMFGFEASLSLVRTRHGLPVVLGRESADAYLRRREPTYEVGLWMATNLPDTARVIGQDHRGFYLPRPYTMELAHRRRTGLGTRGESAETLVSHLRDHGFTHLLLCPPIPETAVEFDPTLSRRLAPWLAQSESLYDNKITDGDGVARRYTILELSPPSRLADVRRARE